MPPKSRRKIAKLSLETIRVCTALIEGRADKKLSAVSCTDGRLLYIHGKPYAKRNDNGSYRVSLHGWKTKLTLSRLNGLLELLHGFQPFFLKKDGSVYFADESREVEAFEVIDIPKTMPESFKP